MKRCSKCQTEYPDDANWCSLDGGKLQAVAGAPAAPAQPRTAPPPSALTMGWDAQPVVSAAETTPSMLAPTPPLPAPTSPAATTPMQLAAAQQAGARMPPQPGALTMGWDAQPD